MSVNRNYKDSVFRLYFNDEARLADLCNALYFADAKKEDIEINTLENAIFLTYKNDISFIVESSRFMLAEHQSTVNPNMPIRDLQYYATIISKYFMDNSIYSSRIIKVPMPVFIVFYNGRDKMPEKTILSLSDAFTEPFYEEFDPDLKKATLELKVLVYNINKGYNNKLKERCRPLLEYCTYMDKIKENLSKKIPLDKSVDIAIDECIKEGIMADFLRDQRSEVRSMSILECDFETEIIKIKRDEREIGQEIGKEIGREIGEKIGEKKALKNLIRKKLSKGITDPETISDMLEIEVEKVKELIEEINREN